MQYFFSVLSCLLPQPTMCGDEAQDSSSFKISSTFNWHISPDITQPASHLNSKEAFLLLQKMLHFIHKKPTGNHCFVQKDFIFYSSLRCNFHSIKHHGHNMNPICSASLNIFSFSLTANDHSHFVSFISNSCNYSWQQQYWKPISNE